MFYEQTTLNCGGRLLDISKPVVMGILNTTPDSFFKDSRVSDKKMVLQLAERMITEGVSILDIGGMSSRPGAAIIEEAEEMQRVLPAIEAVIKYFPSTIISVDTIRANVARAAVEAGAMLVNDISAGNLDEKMFVTIAELGVPYILMHMKDTPKTMQKAAVYDDMTHEILDFFIEKIGVLRGLGVKDIVIDAGFGFGKTVSQNYELLRKLSVFKMLECPMLVGASRKTMIWKLLDITPELSLNGTTAVNMLALSNGAKILRVHDVKEAVETIKIYTAYSESS
ncbi:MAG: dihydropteroate synthase [Saprospiraceae bacterium]|nr:dihydropteroate synthase [Saprospiraceae bacterium]